MKKILITSVLIFVSIFSFCQVPSGFNYQAVLRNSSGELISDQSVDIEISIIDDDSSSAALATVSTLADACSAAIVASGGAGKLEHFYEAVEAGATVLLAASVFHFHIIDIGELKDYLRSRGLNVK